MGASAAEPTPGPGEGSASLTRWAWLSIAAAVATIALKTSAYLLTGSMGLLSDALESVVNLVAAVLALVALVIAARPADDSHHYGHGKAEYFSAAAEGVMIFVAAALILVSSVQRLLNPQPLEALGLGLAITLVATAVNGVVGGLILRAGRRHRSITLVADGKHLLTDVWTSAGVLVGVSLVALTGWLPLDSLVAMAVAVNILWTGSGLVRHAVRGLMDHALPAQDEAHVLGVLRQFAAEYPGGEVEFHALQTRESGRQRFVSLHVLVPGRWPVSQGHDLLERLEQEIRAVLPDAHVLTHLEPREDPRSYQDSTGQANPASAPERPRSPPGPGAPARTGRHPDRYSAAPVAASATVAAPSPTTEPAASPTPATASDTPATASPAAAPPCATTSETPATAESTPDPPSTCETASPTDDRSAGSSGTSTPNASPAPATKFLSFSHIATSHSGPRHRRARESALPTVTRRRPPTSPPASCGPLQALAPARSARMPASSTSSMEGRSYVSVPNPRSRGPFRPRGDLTWVRTCANSGWAVMNDSKPHDGNQQRPGQARNNRVRLSTRRAYGFHTPPAALAPIRLSCGPIELHRPHGRAPTPAHTHGGRAGIAGGLLPGPRLARRMRGELHGRAVVGRR